uniref:Putative gamma-interferon inducible lysosomal thiol reductase n=1 Tax=Ixodes ricinus TaxID=34613 RepID=A0A147BNU5_IXORI
MKHARFRSLLIGMAVVYMRHGPPSGMCASLTKDSMEPESRNVEIYRSVDGHQQQTEHGTSSSTSGKNQIEIANPNDPVVKTNYFVSVSVVKRVRIVVVYESLCPYSRDFVYAQLLPTYSKLSPYITLTMLPFGKAIVKNETDGKGNNVTKISCHHGPSECTGNQIETCVLRVVKTTLVAVRIVACMSTYASPHLAGQGCVEANGVKWSLIDTCVKQHGNEYELQVARENVDLPECGDSRSSGHRRRGQGQLCQRSSTERHDGPDV